MEIVVDDQGSMEKKWFIATVTTKRVDAVATQSDTRSMFYWWQLQVSYDDIYLKQWLLSDAEINETNASDNTLQSNAIGCTEHV